MNILNLFKHNKKKILPPAIVVGSLILAGSVAYAFSPQSPFVAQQSDTSNKTIAYKAKPTTVQRPTPSAVPSKTTSVLGTKTRTVSPQPKSIQPTPITKQESTSTSSSQNTGTGGTTVTNTPVPQQTNSTPTQVPAAQTVSVEIKSPDGSASFTVAHNDGMTVCDVLQRAKDSGKIKSVTLDDSYMASLRSKYVSEINGFANNWTFSVNGSQPLGCSLSQPKPNDSIVWKFG